MNEDGDEDGHNCDDGFRVLDAHHLSILVLPYIMEDILSHLTPTRGL